MTDKEIIKALECCGIQDDCLSCPLLEINVPECGMRLCRESLDLINRQQAEIERLEELFNEWKKQAYKAVDEKEELYSKALEWVRSAKAIAITEFAEMLKERAKANEWNGTICGLDIDNLAKEMVGDDK